MFAPVLKGLLLGLILSISMGPVIFAIIKRSLSDGKIAGYAFVAGVSLSDIALVILCNVFAGVFSMALQHKALIALFGAGFLLVTGIYTLFFKKVELYNNDDEVGVVRKRDLIKSVLSGFFMNTLNPNVFLFWFAWTAAISATADDTSNPTTYKMVVFGTCLAWVLLSDLLKVLLADKVRTRLTEKNLIWINRIAAIIILIFSAVLFYGAFTYY
jgi:threonine/homoserine/homoserine lactone efflux protein